MKRLAKLVSASIVLGLLTTIMTSLLIAAYWPAGWIYPQSRFRQLETIEWMIPVPDDWPTTGDITTVTQGSIGMQFYSQGLHKYTDESTSTYYIKRISHGWPFAALSRYEAGSYVWTSRNEIDALMPNQEWMRGVRFKLPFAADHAELLPTVPSVGFIANSTLFACFYTMIMFLIIFAKSKLKTKRGLCSQCAYPLENLKTCPECGTPADPRTMVQ